MYPTDSDDTDSSPLSAIILRTSLATCPGVQVLLAGAILALGKRTVASALRAMGQEEPRFGRYYRVLSRAVWSSREASRVLLGLLVEAFVPEGEPLVVGIDETLERRRVKEMAATGIYRDPVPPATSTSSKRAAWCMSLLVRIPWPLGFGRYPSMGALAHSER